jgi:5'(3')-deoxyribonucleotidase
MGEEGPVINLSTMVCYLDVDGLVADFVAGACKVHGRGDPYAPGGPGGPDKDMIEAWQMSPTEFWTPIDILGADFWAGLPWTPYGKEVVEVVEKWFTPEKVCLLTSPSWSSSATAGKVEWIQREMPSYHRRFFIGASKHLMAHPNAVLIDDMPKNVDLFTGAGGIGVVFPAAWNSYAHIQDAHTCVEWLDNTLGRLASLRSVDKMFRPGS